MVVFFPPTQKIVKKPQIDLKSIKKYCFSNFSGYDYQISSTIAEMKFEKCSFGKATKSYKNYCFDVSPISTVLCNFVFFFGFFMGLPNRRVQRTL